MATAAPSTTRRDTAEVGRVLAGIVGAVFLLVGIAGFVPGLTSHLNGLSFAGRGSHAELLGIFQVSVLHNIVHLLFGVAGLAASRTRPAARLFLVGGGAVYLGLWLFGVVIDQQSAINFVPVNTADNWLHLGLGGAMVGLGVASTKMSER